jgi:predicted ATPase
MQGHAARGLACINEALERARSLSNPLSLAYALRFAADLHQRCGALDVVRIQADELLALANEQGFAHHAAIAVLLRGWAIAMSGADPADPRDSVHQGIGDMRSGLEAYKATGAIINLPFFFGILAEVCARAGHLDESLTLTHAALSLSRETEECWWDAEILRTRGAVLERAMTYDRAVAGEDAERCYREALAVARKQGARSLELRAAVTLGRYLTDRNAGAEMQGPLAVLLDTFTDGYVSADMTAAGMLLARMGRPD